MELIIKSRNGRLTDRQRAYIEEKLGKLSRYLDKLSKATVELAEEQRRSEGTVHRAQVTVMGERGVLVRAEQSASDLLAAIDAVHDTLQRQITRHKDKQSHRARRRGDEQMADLDYIPAPMDDETDTSGPRIVRTKAFSVKPMSGDEAVEQMELLGHDFFVFRDSDTDGIQVVYRRRDGNYGLIAPNDDTEE